MKTERKSCRAAVVLMLAVFVVCGTVHAASRTENTGSRQIVSLDGRWEIAEGTMDSVPQQFRHNVPVPGLVDMATPAFVEVGQKSERREAFWYRRTFTVNGTIPKVALLKIYKAKYGARLFLNGQLVGEHLPCFTPALFDVRDHLKGSGATNEIMVRVGAFRDSIPQSIASGWDFEKYRYIPGIYDSVELILTGSPYIVRVQTVPEMDKGMVRVLADIQNINHDSEITIGYNLREARTGRLIFGSRMHATETEKHGQIPLPFRIRVKNYRAWSPEDPFLYELELNTGGDSVRVRFGMRSFRFDKETGRAILNGKPYFMRGTNVCIFRFFEDALRGDLPWRKEWVRRLHRKFKSMHWNSIRYCIGFPPEMWYEIADEEGFLIQDEFPIWFLRKENWPKALTSDGLTKEYTEWIQERWNHPCVVIWDAQNETATEETGKTIAAVRDLDLSHRPWDNGWVVPQGPADCVESHPYLFSRIRSGRGQFRLSDLANTSGKPRIRDLQRDYPIIINEYAWLWLNRDGTTTCLTDKIYDSLLGPDSTADQRRLLYARCLAALTEFWRSGRECAGVLHFCGLGYSRAGDKPRPEGGATSDHFLNVETLEFEPNFEKYVKDAFSPVGLMINEWTDRFAPGSEHEFSVIVINDLHKDWKGDVNFRVMHGKENITQQFKTCSVGGLGRRVLSFKEAVPNQVGQYQLVAELVADGKAVRSLRDFDVMPSE
ncbi:MAG: sugar-binding domain-containing protein [Planctomycetota bacterium]